MSLKSDLEEEKKARQEEWQQECRQGSTPGKKKIFAIGLIVAIIAVLVLPWLNLVPVAFAFEAVLLFFLVADGYPLAYVFGRRGMGRVTSVTLSLLIGIVIDVLLTVYIVFIPSVIG